MSRWRTAPALVAALVLAAARAEAPAAGANVADALKAYAGFRVHDLLAWHPSAREIVVARRAPDEVDIARVPDPGVAPIVMDVPAAPTRAIRSAWMRHGDRVAYLEESVPGKPRLRLVDLAKPAGDRVVATLPAGRWEDLRFSEDGRRLAMTQRGVADESASWLVDLPSGNLRRVASAAGGTSWRHPQLSRDGKSLFATVARRGGVRRLVLKPLAGGRERVLTPAIAFDIEAFDVSFDAKLVALVSRERGSDVLRFLDLETFKELPRPPLFDGVITQLRWRPGHDEIGFHLESARTAGDVFSYQVHENRLARWTNGNSPRINTSEFAEPQLARWKSADGRERAGFLYPPPKRFGGPRPVIVVLHTPEAPARPAFLGYQNYLVNELGIAVLRADAGSAVSAPRDLTALLEFMATQPQLDRGRMLVTGASDIAAAAVKAATGAPFVALPPPTAPSASAAAFVEAARRLLESPTSGSPRGTSPPA